MSRRVVGLVVAAVGAVLLLLSAAADMIGLGSTDYFGNRQIIGTVLGAVALAAGLLVAFLPSRPVRPRRKKDTDRPSQPVKHRKR